MTQKIHWLRFMFLISLVFIPKMEANNVNGRNSTVTVVKVRAAFSCRSLFDSTMRKCYKDGSACSYS